MTTNADDLVQRGPCQVCGRTYYPLSFDGPTICPSCDCGAYDGSTLALQVSKLRELIAFRDAEIERLRAEVEKAQAAVVLADLQGKKDAAARLAAEHKLATLQENIAKAPRAKVAKVAAGIASLIAPKELEGKHVHLLVVEQHLPEEE